MAEDAPLLIFVFVIMSLFACIVYYKRNRVESRSFMVSSNALAPTMISENSLTLSSGLLLLNRDLVEWRQYS